jgi:O-antigen/teichoic acid export membrane protein
MSNLVGLGINMITQMIIPRGLGPQAYGDFHFLTKAFTNIIVFFNMGTSSAFFIKLSQNNKDKGLITFYSFYIASVIVLTFLLVIWLHLFGALPHFFPDQQAIYVYMGAFWGLNLWLVQLASILGDAYGLTVALEKVRIVQKLLGLFLILGIYVTKSFSLMVFFVYHYVILLFLSVGLVIVVLRAGMLTLPLEWLSKAQFMSYGHTFLIFVRPLILFMVIYSAVEITDRWLLQKFSGSIQQGYYSLGLQVSELCILFASAMTPLLQRELAKAFAEQNIQAMGVLFRRYLPPLYFLTAYLAGFIAIHANNVVYILGGERFAQAENVIFIMGLYAMQVAYGQLGSGVFYATGQTKLLSQIGIFTTLLFFSVSYFLLVPSEMYGLGAGAVGLATKMFLWNTTVVNLQIFFASRFLRLSYRWFAVHQVMVSLALLGVAWSGQVVVKQFIQATDMSSHLTFFLLSGILYTILTIVLIFVAPGILGVTRKELKSFSNKAIGMLHKH